MNYWIGCEARAARSSAARTSRFLNKKHLIARTSSTRSYGGKTIILARFVPIVRTFAPFVAGMGRMTYRRFMAFNVIGGVVWIAFFLTMGYFFGNLPVREEKLWPRHHRHHHSVALADSVRSLEGTSRAEAGGCFLRRLAYAKAWPRPALCAQVGRADARRAPARELKKSLGALNLVLLGIGCIIGTGIFVLTGRAAAEFAGPGIMISFVITGALCAFVALCYAELAAAIPVSGSAYSYSYASMGEFVAWIMGVLLLLEYGVAASTVAVGWSGYVVSLLHDLGLRFAGRVPTAAPGVGGHRSHHRRRCGYRHREPAGADRHRAPSPRCSCSASRNPRPSTTSSWPSR